MAKRGLVLLGASLLCLQLVLCERVSFDEFRFAGLCAAAFCFLIGPRMDSISMASGPWASAAGMALISFFLIRVSGRPGALFATVSPLFWGTGLALLASGFSGLRQYWREAIVLAAIVVTPFVDTLALDLGGVDLAPTTAKTSALLLRLGGFQASARDVLVGLPTGWVVVSQGCSGLKTMYFLGGFSILVMLLYPVAGVIRRFSIVVVAVAMGFLVNAIRVALLALLAKPEHHRAFLFFHIQQGAMVFEILAIAAFLGVFYLAIPVSRAKAAASIPPPE